MKKRMIIPVLLLVCLACRTALCEPEENVLRIFGKGAAGDWDNPAFHEMMPDMEISGSDHFNADKPAELITTLLSGEAYDLYMVNYSNVNVPEIIRKGYAHDLSGNPGISSAGENLYAFIREAVCDGDGLYAVPFEVQVSHWGYSPEVWEMIRNAWGKALPDDYPGFLDFIEWWTEEGQYDFPNIGLIRAFDNVKETLVRAMTLQVIDIDWHERKNLLVESAEIDSLFERIEKLNPEDLRFHLVTEEGDESLYLFDPYYEWDELGVYAGELTYHPLPLRFGTGSGPVIPADLRVIFINSASGKKAEAECYAETFLKTLDDEESILLVDTDHAPVKNQYIEREIERIDALLEQLYPDGDGLYRDRIAELEWQKESCMRDLWLIPEERIREYRELTPRMFVREYCPVYMSDDREEGYLYQIISKFSQGRMSSMEYLCELRQIVHSAMREE